MVSLVSLAFIDAEEDGLDKLALKARVDTLIDRLIANGAHVHVPREDRDYEVTVGLRMLTLRHIVTETGDGLLRIRSGDKPLVAHYANAIRHLAGDSPAATTGDGSSLSIDLSQPVCRHCPHSAAEPGQQRSKDV